VLTSATRASSPYKGPQHRVDRRSIAPITFIVEVTVANQGSDSGWQPRDQLHTTPGRNTVLAFLLPAMAACQHTASTAGCRCCFRPASTDWSLISCTHSSTGGGGGDGGHTSRPQVDVCVPDQLQLHQHLKGGGRGQQHMAYISSAAISCQLGCTECSKRELFSGTTSATGALQVVTMLHQT